MGFHMSGKILDAVFTSKRFVTLCTIKVGIYMLIQVLFFICLKLALKQRLRKVSNSGGAKYLKFCENGLICAFFGQNEVKSHMSGNSRGGQMPPLPPLLRKRWIGFFSSKNVEI